MLNRYSILARGPFPADSIQVEYRPQETLRLTTAERQEIGRRWREEETSARARRALFFNGLLYRLLGFQSAGGSLRLRLGPTDYRTFVGTRSPAPRDPWAGDRPRAHPLAVCAAVETGEGTLLIERRRGVDLDEGRFHVLGGFVDREQDSGDRGVPDPLAAMARELEEEVGLVFAPGELSCLGLVYDRHVAHPELCFEAKTRLTLAQIRELPTDGEVAGLEGVSADPAGLRRFLLRHAAEMSRTGAACLRLWGARHFGPEWERSLLSGAA